jgi:hypothetical protein
MFAVWIAIAFMTGKKRLRYDAYTPDNLAILFEAMAQQKR